MIGINILSYSIKWKRHTHTRTRTQAARTHTHTHTYIVEINISNIIIEKMEKRGKKIGCMA